MYYTLLALHSILQDSLKVRYCMGTQGNILLSQFEHGYGQSAVSVLYTSESVMVCTKSQVWSFSNPRMTVGPLLETTRATSPWFRKRSRHATSHGTQW